MQQGTRILFFESSNEPDAVQVSEAVRDAVAAQTGGTSACVQLEPGEVRGGLRRRRRNVVHRKQRMQVGLEPQHAVKVGVGKRADAVALVGQHRIEALDGRGRHRRRARKQRHRERSTENERLASDVANGCLFFFGWLALFLSRVGITVFLFCFFFVFTISMLNKFMSYYIYRNLQKKKLG